MLPQYNNCLPNHKLKVRFRRGKNHSFFSYFLGTGITL